MLKLVASMPEFFAHAGNSAVVRGEAFGCVCGRCGREVAAPFEFYGMLIWCLYCGLDFGHVAAIDNPWKHRWSFGITREECIEDRRAMD